MSFAIFGWVTKYPRMGAGAASGTSEPLKSLLDASLNDDGATVPRNVPVSTIFHASLARDNVSVSAVI